ncbi:hypothetical protein F511_30506 [Dorcoceras hygrometricum]|uniref:Uncharacterized protein n=1 Tax=Dorcoceras hygrometricum TaxID=472368 RepID=A0A2Z7BHC5_9LAMI|nr:hypothetical protein F511_30506 [Dorcoceras hygrometricum]
MERSWTSSIAQTNLGCLIDFGDGSRREDIQTETVRGRLSWTGRRYLAETIYQLAGWQSDGNEAKLEPRSSSRAGKNRTSSAADKRGADAEVALEQD